MTCLALYFALASVAYGQSWKRIVPLQSTRADVERALGRPTESNGDTYKFKNEIVSVFYTGGSCEKGFPYGWNVAPDVVTKIAVIPRTKLTLNELGIDVGGYTKTQNIRHGGVDYTNKDTGISIGLNDNGEVVVIQIEPAAKDSRLLCPEAAARQREIDSGESAYISPNIYYSDLSPQEEETRIEIFVDEVKKHPANSKVYIISYISPKECEADVTRRLDRVRDRVASLLGINTDRITAINGGHNSAGWTELYVVRPDQPHPLTTPQKGPASVNRNCTGN